MSRVGPTAFVGFPNQFHSDGQLPDIVNSVLEVFAQLRGTTQQAEMLRR